MTDCEAFEESGGAVLSGSASSAERATWDSHLVACPACRAAFTADSAFLARLRAARESAAGSPLPGELLEEILEGTVRRGRVLSFPRRTLRWAIPTIGIAAAATFVLLSRPALEVLPGASTNHPAATPVATMVRVAPPVLSPPIESRPPEIVSSAAYPLVARPAIRRPDGGLPPGLSRAMLAEAYVEAGIEEVADAEWMMGDALLEAEALETKELIDGLSDEAAQSVLDDLKVEA